MIRLNPCSAERDEHVRRAGVFGAVLFPGREVRRRRVFNVKTLLRHSFAPSKQPVFRRRNKGDVALLGVARISLARKGLPMAIPSAIVGFTSTATASSFPC